MASAAGGRAEPRSLVRGGGRPASSAVGNCQPLESKVRAFGNRLWIENNCGGVTFLH